MSLCVDGRLLAYGRPHRRRIDTVHFPDDEHMVARNMPRIEINIHEKIRASSWFIYKEVLCM